MACRIFPCGALASLVGVCGLSCPHGMWDPSSPTRGQTCVPCIGRWSLNHWSTRGITVLGILISVFLFDPHDCSTLEILFSTL